MLVSNVTPCFFVIFVTCFLTVTSEDRADSESFEDVMQNDEHIPRKGWTGNKMRDEMTQCKGPPRTPNNGNLQCSGKRGCRISCKPRFKFPNGEKQLALVCVKGEWKIAGTSDIDIPDCEPICLPQCQNSGICIAPNECHCPEIFSGPQCQYRKIPCLNFPPPVLNSRRECTTKTCTISCAKNFTFPDGSSITNLICKDGNWVPTRSDWVSVPDCKPVCTPGCENGGICLPLNICQCPQDFSGPQCQYSADVCAPAKLGFNGGYKCTRGVESVSCTLNCPAGVEFTSPPAVKYLCYYENGVFEPKNIPQCDVGPEYQIVPLESSKNSYIKITNYSWSMEGMSMYKHSKSKIDRSFSHYHMKISNSSTDGFERSEFSPVSSEQYQSNISGGLMMTNESVTMHLKRPEPKTCFTWGGTHYKTFDGAIYSFKSSCAHTLLQETHDGMFTIITQNSPGCTNGGLCYKFIKFYIQGKEYILELSEMGIPVFRTPRKILPIPAQLSCGLRVEMSAHFVIASLDSVGASIKWDRGLFVQVKASESLWNRTAGLCGRMNGDPEDDKTGKDRSRPKNVASFAAHWRVLNIGVNCDDTTTLIKACNSTGVKLAKEATQFCHELFSDRRFTACSKAVDLELLQATCEWDYCACNDINHRSLCACETMNIYVRQCFHDGLTTSIAWRHEDLCPVTCTGGKMYKSCGPKTQATCSSVEATSTGIDSSDCEEGCFCPDGTVLHEERCISVDECPCTLRGKLFQPGATIPKKCNTCTCSSGKWLCTEVTCSARCAAVGDPHYVTFDGRHYDFMGKCSYYLLKGDNYSIETENVGCSGAISEAMGLAVSPEGPSCTKSVTIRIGSGEIKLKQNRQVLVNEREVIKLPLVASGAKIRVASSIFLVVNMPNGLEVWWDGISRVYVDAPAVFRGKTRGLCGTFTANQRSDFLTPFGDVEQSVIAFANKWKTSEQCEDLPAKDYHHPCDTNPERASAAKMHCSKLHSEIFSSCHWHVDPQTFYNDCGYDMCSCTTDIERCLCPILANYASDCAAAGVKILWRTEVDECKLRCPAGQEYQICGNSCTRSCSDISFNEDCHQECVEGCNCPEGQTLDAQGECIPIGQCPCQYSGMEFSAGHREVRAGTKSQDLCTCAGGLWSCRPASAEEIKEYPAVADLKSICSAGKNLEVTTCEPAEPRTCRNMHKPIDHSPAVCRAGCICRAGYVLDSPSGSCVEEQKCPCYHGGKSYREGSTMQEDCNTCRCHSGTWNCTDRICAGVCSTWGDSHFTTFDDKTFDFQGVCDYVLVKSSLGDGDCFEVATQNVPCGSSGVACSKAVTLTVGNGINQEKITLTRGKPLPNGTFKRIAIRKAGLFTFLDVPDLGLVLQWDAGTRIYVRLDPKWKGRTRGLCGDYNDNSEDDFKTPSGGVSEASAKIFADSWKKNSYCAEPREIVDTCSSHPERKGWAVEKCGVLKSPLFQPCHSEVDIEPYIQRCIFDTCGCDGGGDCECLCTALAAYAQECNRQGVPVKWRSQELCPMQCDENCSAYSPCISTCPLETCENRATFARDSHSCGQDSCVEGCLPKVCQEDQVYSNSTGRECVPKATCKTPCQEINGTLYYEGDLVSSDDCQKCFCSQGKITCSGALCSTTTTIASPKTEVMDQSKQCIDGWTAWLSTSAPKAGSSATKGGKSSDIEPLPSLIDLLKIEGSALCQTQHMVDIRCRTVIGHKAPKDTGLDVECSLERGLVCESHGNALPCEDFEISVLCHCRNTTEQPTTPIPQCDVGQPNQADKLNCHVFYQCVPTLSGTRLELKTCGPNMLYNPALQICDWPANVLAVRPDCEKQETPRCKDGQRWDECAIKCNQTCQFYRRSLTAQQFCTETDCVAGCVDERITCPPHRFWRDENTCVDLADCPCASHAGAPVKPGEVVKESECERCQCLTNFYTCDKSLCVTTVKPTPPTTPRPSPPIEKQIIIVTSTVSPAVPCSSQYRSLLRDAKSGVQFNASSSATPESRPESAMMIPHATKAPASGGWQPEFMESEQWLAAILPTISAVYGLVIQGNSRENKYVTSYKVLFSQDGQTFSYILDSQRQPKVFQGPIDSQKSVQQLFPEPVEAKIIKINPQTWHHGISLKVDLLGCEDHLPTVQELSPVTPPTIFTVKPSYMLVHSVRPVCDDVMGLDNGVMVEEQVLATSNADNLLSKLKLSSPDIWTPALDSPNQYVQFDFLDRRNLTGIETKGAQDIWTTAYKVFYSDDSRHWNSILDDAGVEKIFLGNFDDKTSKVNFFDEPIRAQYLKIHPLQWHTHVGLKVEVHGCFQPYPAREPKKSADIKVFTAECNVCHEIFYEPLKHGCRCNESTWWNGHICVEKQQCPCVINHIPYVVGASYENPDCQKCICAMGGVPVCHSEPCEPCSDPEMRAVRTELCGCICKPCPTGTRLCRTSGTCIDEDAWCNGVKDCADDETDCDMSHRTNSSSQTFTEHTVVETKNVTTIQCETPVCPPGYKLVPMKKASPIKSSYHSPTKGIKSSYPGIKGGVKGHITRGRIKGSPPQHRPAFNSRMSEDPMRNDTSSAYVECPQYSCKPTKPPPLFPGPKIEECPKAECPPNYKAVFEPLSIYRPVRCPQYICKPPPPAEAVCNITGKTFNTFDNLEYKYDICNHILAREMYKNLWYITLVRQCEQLNQPCTQILTITTEDDLIVLYPDMHVDINDYTFTAQQVNHLGDKRGVFKIFRIGNIIHFVSNKYGFWVIWSKNTDVKIGVSTKLAHHVDGLCGFFDGHQENDRQKPDGSQAMTTAEFGDSWAMEGTPECAQSTCPRPVLEEARKICNLVTDRSFTVCRSVLDPAKYISRCLETMCTCLAGNRTKEECRCTALSAFTSECQAKDLQIDLSTWRGIHNCPAHCPAPLVHKDCFRNTCEVSCDNLQDVDPCPPMPGVCISGCFCPENTVRRGENCVPATECRDCACSGFGNANFVNFDRKNFVFTGNCTYVLSQDMAKAVKGTAAHTYEILMTTVPCERGLCTKAIIVQYKEHFLEIDQVSEATDFVVTLDGQPITVLPYKNPWMTLGINSDRDLTLLIPAIQLEIMSYRNNFGFTVRLPSHIFAGAMEGLCGNCNANDEDDFRKPNGELTDSIDEFGLSWLAKGTPHARFVDPSACTVQPNKTCILPPVTQDPCRILLDEEVFGQCHNLLDPTSFVKSCHDTLCERGNVCSDLEAYARSCRGFGLCPSWRTSTVCPYACPAHLEYRSCGPSCQETCDNLNNAINAPISRCSDFVEGCFCAEGHVLHNDTCVPRRSCLICDDAGHIDGDVWYPDKCTRCTCNKKSVACQTSQCPMLETICQEGFTPVVVPGSEAECCLKYLCTPMPTTPTCPEPQQLECGYGQTMKLTTGPDGCQKFICQCMSPEECFGLALEVSPEVEGSSVKPGYVQEVNSTGCCPRTVLVCRPETCPRPATCPEFYEAVVKEIDGVCCPSYDCEPPKNLCLYSSDSLSDRNITAKKIGEHWQDGPCKSCVCEKVAGGLLKASCLTKECGKIHVHPDIDDYVLKEMLVTGECCPQVQRVSCKDHRVAYSVGQEWKAHPEDACVIIKCEQTLSGIQKKTITQECNRVCDRGYEYRPPKDKGSQCCGECVAVACVINSDLKNIGDKWHSEDFCINYECLSDNETLRVKEETIKCESMDPHEAEEYEMVEQIIAGHCCSKYARTGCRSGGKVYKPGSTWKNESDSCITGTCVVEEDKIKLVQTVQLCETTCEPGWEYANPPVGECCGKCKQTSCTINGQLYKPGSIWYSEDKCTTYECVERDDQLMVMTSQQKCPVVTSCPLKDIYFDGCCKRCNLTALDLKVSCMVDVLNFDTTVGIMSENMGRHGICRNLEPIQGMAECRGHCDSTNYLNPVTWVQETDCHCCQPTEMRSIFVNLTCEDGKILSRIVTVPAACSCNACKGPTRPLKKHVSPVKG